MNGIEEIAQERQKQIAKHGFTGEHHATYPEWYSENQLINAAQGISQYTPDNYQNKEYRNLVPNGWDLIWWQSMCDRPLRERLIIAGALLAAEIDRIDSAG